MNDTNVDTTGQLTDLITSNEPFEKPTFVKLLTLYLNTLPDCSCLRLGLARYWRVEVEPTRSITLSLSDRTTRYYKEIVITTALNCLLGRNRIVVVQEDEFPELWSAFYRVIS